LEFLVGEKRVTVVEAASGEKGELRIGGTVGEVWRKRCGDGGKARQ
jgi:hypothetical protein